MAKIRRSMGPSKKENGGAEKENTSGSEIAVIDDGVGKLLDQPLVDEVSRSYLDYAMSVIVGRALPDVRDGLKPSNRRILYAMYSIGLRHNAKFRKSATIVGEVLGKYHPHGDAAVYETMVRMAQEWAMRYQLVWGQGNFGSMDGDNAAAYRYTEAKLTTISEELLQDIEKDTVKMVPNFDNTLHEPTVLPAKLPQLLLNGTLGIAVGMATDIPPHNLRELCDGITALIENPHITVKELMQFVKGPDFPTGGIMYNVKDIETAYTTGRGGIVLRAKTEIVENKNGMFSIIVSEVPYRVNKATLLEKIALLVQEKKIEDIKDLRDESNKNGVRVVIELKKDAYPKKVLNKLFKLTQLQDSFHVNMLALVDGIQPRVLTLKMMLEEYLKHREVIVKRRTEYDLMRAKDRAHILEGLKIALDHIDAVITTIRKSKDRDEAKTNLMKKFDLSDRQAVAILEMKLQSLANLERKKVDDELAEKKKFIKEMESILASRKRVMDIIKNEVKELKDKYGDDRRTQIVAHGVKEFSVEDLVPNEPTLIMTTLSGYIKRLPPDTFKLQGRGGKGVIGLATKEEDAVSQLVATNTHDDLLFFTNRGRVFLLKAYDIPQASRTSKGQALVNFLQLAPNEKVTSMISIDDVAGYKYLMMVTVKGTIKKTDIKDFDAVRRSGLIAIKLKDGDNLEWVKPTTGEDEVVIATSKGQAIRFKEAGVRGMGRTAGGVRGMRLKNGDIIVGMDLVDPKLIKQGAFEVLAIMANGYGKRTNIKEFKVQARGGSGVKVANVTTKTGNVVSMEIINKDAGSDLLVISEQGQTIRLAIQSVPILGRATQGVRVMRFKEASDKVAGVTLI